MRFVDVHTHMVPSGDDGAATIEEALTLCREAARRNKKFGNARIPLTEKSGA